MQVHPSAVDITLRVSQPDDRVASPPKAIYETAFESLKGYFFITEFIPSICILFTHLHITYPKLIFNRSKSLPAMYHSKLPAAGPSLELERTRFPAVLSILEQAKQRIVNEKKSPTKPMTNIPPTRVPEKYHIYEKSPLLPAVISSDQDAAFFAANSWQRSSFPSMSPSDRREVKALGQTMDLMLQVSKIIDLG